MTLAFETTPSDWVADQNGDRIPNATVSFWTSRTGGVQILGTLVPDGGGSPVDTIQADQRAQVPSFTDPTDTYVDGVWADGTADGSMAGFRTMLTPTDTARRVSDLTAQVATLQAAVDAMASGASGEQVAGLAAQVTALTSAVADTQADLASTKDQVLTIEEPFFTFNLVDNAGATATFFTRPIPIPEDLLVLSVSIVWKFWAVAADATNYWTVSARRLRAGSGTTLAQRSTRSGGGPLSNGPITALIPWTFDAAVWSDRSFLKDDCFSLLWTPSGSPPAFDSVASVTVRYQPI